MSTSESSLPSLSITFPGGGARERVSRDLRRHHVRRRRLFLLAQAFSASSSRRPGLARVRLACQVPRDACTCAAISGRSTAPVGERLDGPLCRLQYLEREYVARIQNLDADQSKGIVEVQDDLAHVSRSCDGVHLVGSGSYSDRPREHDVGGVGVIRDVHGEISAPLSVSSAAPRTF